MVDLDMALKVVDEINQHGYKAYLVGGMVRNHLLGLPSNDVDITTNATPKEILEIFDDSVPMEEYGAVTVNKKGIKYEITTFRKEYNYVNHRKPSEIKYIDDLYQDLQRRDFTVNTICMNGNGEIIDYLGGEEDLKKRIIKAVGDAKVKFEEDALRILRAVRFATILDFTFDVDVVKAIKETKHYLMDLSYERKKEELDKIFSCPNAYKGVQLLLELGLDKDLELDRLNEITPNNNSIGIWSILNVVDKYPFSNNEKELISSINEAMNHNNMDPMTLYTYGLYANSVAGTIKDLDIKDITDSYNNLVIHGRKELDITSEEIMNVLNKEPGEYMSDIYADIEREVLYKRLINENSILTKYILEHYKD
ncbi:MAG: CCA tRNA nucleotidyltransferase [Bacilli bacterium]|nr:CCA tRNA nucleotidyltransferase [Bacilli bacterium]